MVDYVLFKKRGGGVWGGEGQRQTQHRERHTEKDLKRSEDNQLTRIGFLPLQGWSAGLAASCFLAEPSHHNMESVSLDVGLGSAVHGENWRFICSSDV